MPDHRPAAVNRPRTEVDPRYQAIDAFSMAARGFVFCRDCGCVIMQNYRDEHDRWHTRILLALL